MKNQFTSKDIESLYRQYKLQRNDLDQYSYATIKKAVKERIDAKKHEVEIEKIMQAVRQHAQSVDDSAAKHLGVDYRLKSSMRLKKQNLINVCKMPMMQWTAGITALAGVTAIAVLLLMPWQSVVSKHEFVASVLKNEKVFISELQSQDQLWHHGFASVSASEFEALRSGVLIAGWLNQFDGLAIPDEKTQKMIVSYLQNSQLADKYDWQEFVQHNSLQALHNKLCRLYSQSSHDTTMYKLGQWLQYHFLLASVAEKKQDSNIFTNNFAHDKDLMQQAHKYLQTKDILSQADLAFINNLNNRPVEHINYQQLIDLKWQLMRIKMLLQNT